MSEPLAQSLLAIDVGSSRVKLGWYPATVACDADLKPSQLPIAAPKLREPEDTRVISHMGVPPESFFEHMGDWLGQVANHDSRTFLASVHTEAAQQVLQSLSQNGYQPPRQLSDADLPIKIQLPQPEKVGIDRLLNAVAVNRLREPGHPAIVVDLGTANTVDLITENGAFAGGAILPGIAMSARALHDNTSTLPHLSADTLDPPDSAVGKSTHEAIASGLYWGTVGSISELVRRISRDLKQAPQLFITGGDARLLAPNLVLNNRPARHIPHLVLAGIHIAAEELS